LAHDLSVACAGCDGKRKQLLLTFMANKKWAEHHFSKALKDQRDRREWSQAQLAKMLANKDIHMHWTTIAKIEKGERSVRIDEAAAIADLFDVSVDTLLGRKPTAQRDLRYALGALTDAVFTSRTELHRTSKTLQDRLDDIPREYEGYDSLARLVRGLSKHLDAANAVLDELIEPSIADIEQRAIEQVAKQLKRTRPAGKEQKR
jgi:transcriptional regulator with XRE-family HTH domain